MAFAAATNKAAAAVIAAEVAIQSIGLGYDVAVDLRLKYCKRCSPPDSSLIAIDDGRVQTIVIPGGISIPNVPKSIKCDKGERIRFRSDVLNFTQMSEQFNQEINISGKVPLGHFNSAFEYSGCWQQDAANTKTLAFDGVGITLYNIALEKSQLVLRDHVKQAVPSSWDPAALSRFIEKFGTHIVVGIKIGGKDMIYAKQQHSSLMVSNDVQKKLKEMADTMFIGGNEQFSRDFDKLENTKHGVTFMDSNPSSSYLRSEIQEVTYLCKRKGGSTVKTMSHNDWCLTVQSHPDVISMSFVPITSLLSGLQGSGFLSHAINLYLRYKPPIEELHQFLDFQLPRQWAPVFGELALGPQKKKQSSASLQFSFMGPKLYVNTTIVDVGKRPVTGLRLYLEGKRSNCLAIHLQHLSSLPSSFQLKDEPNQKSIPSSLERKYFEKVQWKSFSHICTVPVESDDDLSVVTGAHFEVGDSGFKKILFLRLHFAKVIGATVVKIPEWDGSPGVPQKSGLISTIISTRFTTGQKPLPRPSDVNVNSAIYPGGPPTLARMSKLLKFVDMTEMARGPQNTPGYWAVSGARLLVEKGKISLKVKYSLLTVILPDDDDDEISMEF